MIIMVYEINDDIHFTFEIITLVFLLHNSLSDNICFLLTWLLLYSYHLFNSRFLVHILHFDLHSLSELPKLSSLLSLKNALRLGRPKCKVWVKIYYNIESQVDDNRN